MYNETKQIAAGKKYLKMMKLSFFALDRYIVLVLKLLLQRIWRWKTQSFIEIKSVNKITEYKWCSRTADSENISKWQQLYFLFGIFQIYSSCYMHATCMRGTLLIVNLFVSVVGMHVLYLYAQTQAITVCVRTIVLFLYKSIES